MTLKITPKPANLYKPQMSHKFMKSMAIGGLARFIALEAIVEIGRTYQAYQRGGFDEGRERISEEFTGAVFWLGGVKAFNAINDKIGKWILKMRTANFDLGSDSARDPLANFIHQERTVTKPHKAFTENQIAKFKSAKLITSILMANAMIGFVVPRLNQTITRYYHRNDPKYNKDQKQVNLPINSSLINMDKFIENSEKNKKNIAFGAGSSALLSVAYNLENNTTWQLLSTDIGTASGRAISARNEDERREILFRDLTSIYFYMWNMPNMNKWLNKIQQNGRGTRVDTMNAAYTKDLMAEIVNKNYNGQISASQLQKEMFGAKPEYTLPKHLETEFKNGWMSIDQFKEKIKSFVKTSDIKKYTEIADKMSQLQPKVAGSGRITLEQARKVFKDGYLNNPDFLKELYSIAFGNDSSGIANFFRKLRGKEVISGQPNYLNPYKFISNSDIEAVESDLKYFVKQIIEKAQNTKSVITEDTLNKAVKANFRKNILNWGSGFIVSALFLSTLIPKMQYWLTKKITGSDAFPGTEQYRMPDKNKGS